MAGIVRSKVIGKWLCFLSPFFFEGGLERKANKERRQSDQVHHGFPGPNWAVSLAPSEALEYGTQKAGRVRLVSRLLHHPAEKGKR